MKQSKYSLTTLTFTSTLCSGKKKKKKKHSIDGERRFAVKLRVVTRTTGRGLDRQQRVSIEKERRPRVARRKGGAGGRRGVHPGDRSLSEISQRWSFYRIITRSTPPSRRTPSVQVRSGVRGIPRQTLDVEDDVRKIVLQMIVLQWKKSNRI